MKGLLPAIASHKFLPLIYQLAARLMKGDPKQVFQQTLQDLIGLFNTVTSSLWYFSMTLTLLQQNDVVWSTRTTHC